MNKTKRTYSASELATETHLPLRTVRYYRSQRLLPAPEGKGPAARYTDEHLNVLNAIHDARNYLPLAQIRRQMENQADLANQAQSVEAPAIAAFFANVASDPASAASAAGGDSLGQTEIPAPGSAAEYAAGVLRSMSGYVSSEPGPNTWSAKPGPVRGGFINEPFADIPDVLGAMARGSSPHPDSDAEPLDIHPGLVLHGSNPPGTALAALGLPPARFSSSLPAGSKYQSSSRSTWERIPLGADLELHVQRPSTRAGNRALERIITSATDILKEEGLI
jgi:DNA-binding transcriptional MerR regulator